MSKISERLREFLAANDVRWEALHHPVDFRARDTAAHTDTPPQEFAKTVFVCVDGDYAMAVLPADHSLREGRLQRSLGANHVRLASESQFAELCPGCEVGAAPPFGNLFDLPVYVSPALVKDEHITFNAGTHEDAIRMSYEDFCRLVKPRVVPMARNE